jgi:hypothetical protein
MQDNGSTLQKALWVLLISASLLAPTLLCAVPLSPLNVSEMDCCQHMNQQDCGKANMSSCCTPIAPNLAFETPTVAKRVFTEVLTSVDVNSDVTVATMLLKTMRPDDSQGSSPPTSHTGSPFQVLRI